MTDLPAIAADPQIASSDAEPVKKANVRICPNCSEPFERPTKGPGGHKRYCSTACRREWDARSALDGKAIAVVARIWAQNRKGGEVGNKAFARLREALDLINERDSRSGRLRLKADGPLDAYVREVLAEPYMDRRRR